MSQPLEKVTPQEPLLFTEDNRDFQFTAEDFTRICALVKQRAGIALSEHKKDLVYGRLARRLRVLGIPTFKQYCDFLQTEPIDELEQFTNALTTNLTAFFREEHHFDYFSQTLLPELASSRRRSRIRIWSAGCSTGEEPYSIAISALESDADLSSFDFRVLATDLDSNVVSHASSGIYTSERLDGLDPGRRKWFMRGCASNEGRVRVREQLRDMISFKQLNLMENWPIKGSIDAIFCRNVVIYFDLPTKQRLIDRFADLLPDDGVLFIGHSETLHNVSERFELVGKTVYRKIR